MFVQINNLYRYPFIPQLAARGGRRHIRYAADRLQPGDCWRCRVPGQRPHEPAEAAPAAERRQPCPVLGGSAGERYGGNYLII